MYSVIWTRQNLTQYLYIFISLESVSNNNVYDKLFYFLDQWMRIVEKSWVIGKWSEEFFPVVIEQEEKEAEEGK